jgi:cobalt-zinc-cadmium efflux system membrane fusion protein
MRKYLFLSYTFLVLLNLSCSNETSIENGEVKKVESSFIEISESQFKAENMELGDVQTMNFRKEVACNGYITASRNGIASVNSHITGIVETIDFSIGDYVKKGQVLLSLSSNDFISLQEEFTITASRLKVTKSNYERSKKLFNDKVSSEKEFNEVESEYRSMMARYNSLKKRLEILKLNVGRIERGSLYHSLPIFSPINGYITSRNVVLGQYIDSKERLMEIVNNKKLQLKLSVFEKDVNEIMVGQKVDFSLVDKFDETYFAKISTVGKAIDEQSKTIQCIAKIDGLDNHDFVNKSFVNAKIVVDNSEVKALSDQAIINLGKDKYVLMLDKIEGGIYFFKKVKVSLGSTSRGFVEVTSDIELKNVLVKGVYNIGLD